MDTKRLLPMMLISFAVIFGWQIYVAHLYSKHPEWKRPGQQEAAATQPATTEPSTTQLATTQSAATTGPVASTQAGGPTMSAAPGGLTARPATNPVAATIGDNADTRMLVKIAPEGAGLESVTLKDFKAPGGKGEYTFQTPYTQEGAASVRSMATWSVTVNGVEIPTAHQPWSLDSQTANSATYSLDLGPVRVRKVFEVQTKDPKNPRDMSRGFELLVHHEIENTGGAPAKVKIAFGGTTTPPRESERGPDLQVLAAHDTGYEKISIDHHAVEEFTEKTPSRDMTVGEDKQRLLWGGTASVYFVAFVRPVPIDKDTVVPKYIEKLTAAALNPASEPTDRHVALTFATSDFTIAPGQTQSVPTEVFLGPRWRAVLNQPPFSEFPRSFDESLVLTSGPCGYCTFQWLIGVLVGLLNVFHWVFGGFAGHGDWGLAIIALVVLVRLLLHPITKRSQISMVRMGKMGPEMERLKKKYGEDKDELNKQMMALYKDQGVGAYLGCLPMFLQMPIWIALWSALQSTFELRQAPFLWGFTWIQDLARPDAAFSWAPIHFTLPLLGDVHFGSINLLPILMGIVYFLQQKFTPKPPATTPEQETQQKMMQWMSLLFPLFLYNGPSGLNLYILTSTSIGIIESKRIRDHIKEQEEAEKTGQILIDAPKGMKKKRDDDGPGPGVRRRTQGPQEPPKTGFAGWIAQLKQKANELQREAERTKGK
jgi:YidC/Oxa1 family membrane protein insertase